MGFGVWSAEPGSGVLQSVTGVQARRQGLRDCEGFLLSGWKAVEGGASTGLRVRPRFREIQLEKFPYNFARHYMHDPAVGNPKRLRAQWALHFARELPQKLQLMAAAVTDTPLPLRELLPMLFTS